MSSASRFWPPLALAFLLVLALLAGCGGSGSTTTTVIDQTVTETTNSAESTPTTTATTTPTKQVRTLTKGATTTKRETTPTKQIPAPTKRATKSVHSSVPTLHLTAFQSPSGNIGCILLGGIARCDIIKRNWSPPPRPPGCPDEVDFGQGLEIGRRDTSGSFVCAGDTALNPEDAKLAYGSDDRSGGFLCASRTSGITCTNAAGHGFFLSVQRYRTF